MTKVLFALLGFAWSTLAQLPGTFVATGRMTTPRSFHTATLLKDGRVLFTGGERIDPLGRYTHLASAELYDPSTGTFSPTGDMTTVRERHTATLLADGRVLIVAGFEAGDHYLAEFEHPSSSEVYDPATGVFTRSGNMTARHNSASANLLSTGKVLVTGWPTAELYDPASGVFTALGPANHVQTYSTALLGDSLVVVADNGISTYTITGDSLNLVANLPARRYLFQTTTLLASGKILIAGGEGKDYDATLNEASLFDPHSGSLESTGLLLFSREIHTATLLPNGHVLIVGGYDGDAYDTGVPVLTDAEDYDPSTGSFSSAGRLVYIRQGQTATLLPDGTVLVAGGRNDTAIAELYIPPYLPPYVPPLRAGSAASLTGPLAPESLASLFGSNLAAATESADHLSPPISLGGISLRVIDSSGPARLAPLFYVSPSQINFEVPTGTATGKVTLEVVNAPAQIDPVAAQVDTLAPALFAYEDNTALAYALRIEPDGRSTVLSVRTTIVLDDRPVYLVMYATGIRNRSSLENVRCTIGGTSLPVEYAGPNGSGMPGLDQVNVRLTSDLKGLGVTKLVLTVDGIPSNTVWLDIR
jgi:uncharacterized protein (TIGR03437 family)